MKCTHLILAPGEVHMVLPPTRVHRREQGGGHLYIGDAADRWRRQARQGLLLRRRPGNDQVVGWGEACGQGGPAAGAA